MFGITVILLKLRSVAFAQITVGQRDLAKLRLDYISRFSLVNTALMTFTYSSQKT
jgi:hypothetical protein